MGLLKGIDPLLTADLLHVLRAMGHGDVLAIVDCNFPAAEVATRTTTGKHIELHCDLPTAVGAVCSLMPLDFFADEQAAMMGPQVGVSRPPAGDEVEQAAVAALRRHCPSARCGTVERFKFYDDARKAFAVVQVMERRPYGNILIPKGVIGPDGKDLTPSSKL